MSGETPGPGDRWFWPHVLLALTVGIGLVTAGWCLWQVAA